MTTNVSNLVSALATAAKRHDEMLAVYPQACRRLFDEMNQIVQSLRAPDGRRIFHSRIESGEAHLALVVKSSLTNRAHIVGTHVLNFQAAGIGYHPSNGGLCGFVELILSGGDYWDLFKRSRMNPFVGIAVGMMSQRMASDMYEGKRRQLESIQNITRETLDMYWTWADKPGIWHWTNPSDNQIQQLDVKEYLYVILDAIYNPEHKEWVYKPEGEGEERQG